LLEAVAHLGCKWHTVAVQADGDHLVNRHIERPGPFLHEGQKVVAIVWAGQQTGHLLRIALYNPGKQLVRQDARQVGVVLQTGAFVEHRYLEPVGARRRTITSQGPQKIPMQIASVSAASPGPGQVSDTSCPRGSSIVHEPMGLCSGQHIVEE
jgi:hypothetical protein